jgi:hypothetical protein
MQTLILSFNSTTNRLLSTNLVALKLAIIFAFKNTCLNTFIKVAIKAFLLILLILSEPRALVGIKGGLRHTGRSCSQLKGVD